MMKFTSFAVSLAILLLPTLSLADPIMFPVTYDQAYDNASQSLDTVACSNGEYGLEPTYTTFGSLPDFPYIGGAAAIGGWDSPNCGTCWQLSYTDGSGVTTTIDILAIDVAEEGFNISLEAMNALTNQQAVQLGTVNVQATQVDASVCGL